MTDVFLSYAREDRARARVLAQALEATGLSVWWDRQIIAGQAFDEIIERELDMARSVVVLWSRHSVVSEWVKNEAQAALGRGALVPAVIDAVKVPLEFRRKQTADLIGWDGDADDEGFGMLRRGVAAHVVADVIPLPADTSAVLAPTPTPTRDPAPRSRRRAALWIGAAVLLTLTVASLWVWDAFYRQHIAYYANVTRRAGLPQGIGALSAEQLRHRNVTLAFFKRGRRGPVAEIRAVNSRGVYPPEFAYFPPLSLMGLNPMITRTSEIMKTCRVTFEYENGRIVRQAAYDRNDRPIYSLHYPQPEIGEYKWDVFSRAIRESGISHIRFVRPAIGPEAGLDKDVLFLDGTGKPSPDHDGSYGYRRVFDKRGLALEAINLGADGRPLPDRRGVAKVAIEYDDPGNFIREVTRAADGRPVMSGGHAEIKARYDRYGNISELVFFGADGQPVTSADIGAAGQALAYDDRGNLVENTFFGPDRQLVVGPFGFAKLSVVWDDKGGSLETYLGPDGKPMLNGRFFKIKGQWDERGRLIEAAYLDESDRPVRDANGCASQRFDHDEHGNVADVICRDESGQAVRDRSGAARMRREFDDRGNMLEERYFGPADQPGLYDEPYVKVRWAYDPQGNKTEEAYFDAADRQVKRRDGYAKVTYQYDLHGNLRETAFFDEGGLPTTRKGGYAKIVREYDAQSRLIEETVLDIVGRPVRAEDGFAKLRYVYDSRGYRTETSNYDERDRPAMIKGCGKTRREYNGRGQVTAWQCIGLDGSPAVGTERGYATARYLYDARDKLSRLDFLDVNGHRTTSADGYARIRYSYDDLGRETKRTFFDVKDEPVWTRVTVVEVTPGSKSHQLDIRSGDAILAYDGREITDQRQFNELELVAGERERQITVERAGKSFLLNVPAGRLTGIEIADRSPTARPRGKKI